MARDLRAIGAISMAEIARLQIVARFDTLEDVLRWNGMIVDVIVQDEYTHDVIVATASLHVVFDTT